MSNHDFVYKKGKIIMTRKEIAEKITRLLALAKKAGESANGDQKSTDWHESQAAMLAARRLIVRYKISEKELRAEQEQSVESLETDFTFSKRKELWILDLANTIAPKYCCASYTSRFPGKQTRTICFMGFEEDLKLCNIIFAYAVNCVRASIKAIQSESAALDRRTVKDICSSYAYGFVDGLRFAFERQDQDDKEFALVLAVPSKVQEAFEQKFGSKKKNVVAFLSLDEETCEPLHPNPTDYGWSFLSI